MIFQRSIPPMKYADYTLYRPLLRQDFADYNNPYCNLLFSIARVTWIAASSTKCILVRKKHAKSRN
jgi:hypothetical protein